MDDSQHSPVADAVWYAMSAPYHRELQAREWFGERGIETFVPMRREIVTLRDGHKSHKLVPAIHNLIFVHTTSGIMRELKPRLPIVQYLTHPVDGRNRPILVPEAQMQQFIRVSNSDDDRLLYLRPEELNLRHGTPVRIIGGPFDGVEGTFVKVQGVRNRRVVVQLQGLLAIAAEVHPDLIQVIKN